MKRLPLLSVFTILLALSFLSIQCGKSTEIPTGNLALLKMLPEEATGYVQFNFKKLADLGIIKSMRESVNKEDSEKGVEALNSLNLFISQTGFDPEKDLQGGALAVFESTDNSKPLIAFVAQGSIIPEKMITFMKTQSPNTSEEVVDGITFYHLEKQDGEATFICFPKTGIVAAGNLEQLKKTVAVIQGKGRSLMDAPRFSEQTKNISGDSIISAVFSIPEKVRSMTKENLPPPFEFDMSKAEAFTAELFYKSEVWSGTLAIVSPNPEGNKKNANTLNTLKGFAALLGPEVGDVVNGLSIKADDKRIEINFSVTKAQLEKMGKKAKESLPGMSADSTAEITAE